MTKLYKLNVTEHSIPQINTGSYWSYKKIDPNSQELKNYFLKLKEFVDKVQSGEDVFVEYTKSNYRREHTIAKVYGLSDECSKCVSRWLSNFGKSTHSNDYVEYIICNWLAEMKIKVKFDDRKNRLVTNFKDVAWLEGYSGKTSWSFRPPKAKILPPARSLKDRLGNEINIGDLVMFATKSYSSSLTTYIGNVTKISDRNVVYCTNIKLSPSDYESEIRISNNSTIIRLTDDIFDDIMMRKLQN